MQHREVDKFRKKRIKTMVANSEMKHKSETMLDVIKGQVLDFVL